jgi:hypothetical protein
MKKHDPDGGDDAKSREGLDLSGAHKILSVRPLVSPPPRLHHQGRLGGYQCGGSIASVDPAWLGRNTGASPQAGTFPTAHRAANVDTMHRLDVDLIEGPNHHNSLPIDR